MPASNLGNIPTLVIPTAHAIFYEMGLNEEALWGLPNRQ
jgi:hypothetical protein